ncbi:30S ribosomal protein S3 [Halorubrum sp. Atlit-8R]|uniref:Small ribosomal subunit protein uS3 n=1 Tax=Halorubrum salinarum TaxID=2739057 RepID=A0A7D3Y1H7_9EURY|nr:MULTISPECIES: 30S ribosomal protein S3 [Halorubrum]QKG92853.1 30S ribosomal protein S3 [Halorubrum salinarum]RLM67985.1 30S ribosomal protein S3 [Halorubrum sp. Atlit-9R]RLM81155.1 30S ribosomal protein S3 [Halorubrum sp. Atlit-8R]TKX87288.1 30S ribosomal protein S3 [Halorubrum sp. SS5]
MADEHQFIEDGLRRSQINEFFADELGRAGYGGMDVAQTPMGTQIVLKAEKPGMVIGKGGKNIRKITTELEERFDMDDPQIDVQEVDEPDLNAQIVADRLANALERGWYFRKAGHTTIDRIMDAGALGAEIVLSGKVTGARSRVEKFNRGYIKHNGEPAEEVVDHGQGVAVMKLGTIGVNVKIIPPGATLPDDFQVREDAEVPEVEQAAVDADADEGVESLLEEDPDEVPDVGGDDDVDVPDEDPAEVIDEEVVEEVVEETQETAAEATDVAAEEPVDEDVDADELDDLDEEIESEAADLVAEMEAADEEDEEDE